MTDPRFAGNSMRFENNDTLTSLIEQALREFTSNTVIELLDRVGIANAKMRTMREFSDHPQLIARNRWRDVESPVGKVRALLPPVIVRGREAAMRPVPSLGQHSAEIRREFLATETKFTGSS